MKEAASKEAIVNSLNHGSVDYLEASANLNVTVKLYKRRWLLLVLFITYTINNSMQWMQLTIINNIVTEYYSVPETAVEWTSLVYLISYVIFLFPSLYYLDKFGIRNSLLTAITGLSLGIWIKWMSVGQDKFVYLMVGQTFTAIVYVLNFGMAARFSALWFGAEEISLAGSLALLGDQLGTALGFLIPPMLVKNSSEVALIEDGMKMMHLTSGILSTTTLILAFMFFKSKPEHPPSLAQAVQQETDFTNLFDVLKKILSNRSFLIMAGSYALSLGVLTALSTLLNETVLKNFKNQTQDAGNIGFVIQITGVVTSILISSVLDNTRKFKENSILLTAGGTIAVVLFTIALKSQNILYVYLSALLIGLFLQSYYSTGVQICIEVTYPVSEGISTAIMFLFVQLFGVILTLIYSYACKQYDDVIANCVLVCVMIVSTILAILIPSELMRQNVENTTVATELN